MLNRRTFLGSAAAAVAMARAESLVQEPVALKFGALADIHIRELASAATFEKALRWFDAQKVDAVLCSGDLADFGLAGQLANVAATWFKVFPGNKCSDGAPVVPLFHYGDHDCGLNPATLERCCRNRPDLQADKSIPISNRKAIWESCFKEEWHPIELKTVKGYKFVLYHFTNGETAVYSKPWGSHAEGLPEFLSAHAEELKGAKPFFYSQHRIMRGTAGGPFAWGQDDGYATETLSKWPNCFAFCGHGHLMGTDERNIWQGGFTAVETPSLSYQQMHAGRENGFCLLDKWREATVPERQMPMVDAGSDYRPIARQGYLVTVRPSSITLARRDFLNDCFLGPDWVVPLPLLAERPFSHDWRAEHDPAPVFPKGAKATLAHIEGKDRAGKAERQIVVSFPAALAQGCHPRAYDYEVQASLVKGEVSRVVATKRVYSTHCFQGPSQDTDVVTCVFAEFEIPSDRNYVEFAVRPLNAFGRRGAPLICRL